MKKNKGAISIFALLSMMFFLIFIMVAYNNVSQKARTQVESEGILVNYYKSTQTAREIIDSLNGGDISNNDIDTKIRGTTLKGKVTTENKDKYIYSNGKIYKIKV